MKGYLKQHWHLVFIGALLLTTITSLGAFRYFLHNSSYDDIATSIKVINYLIKAGLFLWVFCFVLLNFIILYRKFKTKNETWVLKESPNKMFFVINVCLWLLIGFMGLTIITLPTFPMFNNLSFYQTELHSLKDSIKIFLYGVVGCNIAYLYALYISNKQNNLRQREAGNHGKR